MNHKLLSAISLCRKAGKLRMGMDVVREAVQDGSAKLVLLASDLAKRSEGQILAACEGRKVPVHTLPLDMEALWQVTGKKYGILAVCEDGFAKMIIGLLSEI